MSDTCIEMDRIGSFVNSFPKYQFIGVSIVMPVTCVAMILWMGWTKMENTLWCRTIDLLHLWEFNSIFVTFVYELLSCPENQTVFR